MNFDVKPIASMSAWIIIRRPSIKEHISGSSLKTMPSCNGWAIGRQALEELGFGDFDHSGSLLVLTKEPHTSALYWHQDCGCDGTTRSVALLGRKRCFSPITLRKHESKMAV